MADRPRRMTGVTNDARKFILEEDPRNTFDGRAAWVARRTMEDAQPYGTLASSMDSRGCPERGDLKIIAGAVAMKGRHDLIIPHPRPWSVTLERLTEVQYDDRAYGMLRTALREATFMEFGNGSQSLTLKEARELARRTLEGMGEPALFDDMDVCDAFAELGIERRRDGRWYF